MLLVKARHLSLAARQKRGGPKVNTATFPRYIGSSGDASIANDIPILPISCPTRASSESRHARYTMRGSTFDPYAPAPPPPYPPNQNTNTRYEDGPNLQFSYDRSTHTTYHNHQSTHYHQPDEPAVIGSFAESPPVALDATSKCKFCHFRDHSLWMPLISFFLPFLLTYCMKRLGWCWRDSVQTF
jgi:hypothetical protein